MVSLSDPAPTTILLTDAGLETVLVFHEGWDLPSFAAFPLLDSAAGRAALDRYLQPFVQLAAARDTGLILETPTWRANRDWGRTVGYSEEDLRRVQHDAVAFVRDAVDGSGDVAVSGSVGPRGDGYVPGARMTADHAAEYHHAQVRDLLEAGAELVTSFTLSYADEGVGFAAAARDVGIPAVVGFTVEQDGRLASGETLGEAVERVDEATGRHPSWFMVNCAHPDHIAPGLAGGGAWLDRIGALRANASRHSHAELDAATELDDGDPVELADGNARLHRSLPALRVVGGCCGTDIRHVTAIADALL
jgi:homocysteine S-methyltransferase